MKLEIGCFIHGKLLPLVFERTTPRLTAPATSRQVSGLSGIIAISAKHRPELLGYRLRLVHRTPSSRFTVNLSPKDKNVAFRQLFSIEGKISFATLCA
jgi:hypothetical protein